MKTSLSSGETNKKMVSSEDSSQYDPSMESVDLNGSSSSKEPSNTNFQETEEKIQDIANEDVLSDKKKDE